MKRSGVLVEGMLEIAFTVELHCSVSYTVCGLSPELACRRGRGGVT